MRWWQTWWAIVPALFLCFPIGLIGVWQRPSLSSGSRIGISIATALVVLVVALTGGDTTAPTPTTRGRNASPIPSPPPSSAAPEPAEDSVAPSEPSTTPVETLAPTPEVPPSLTMPAVAGLPRAQAQEALAAAGIAVRVVRKVPSADGAGTVLRQNKQAGTSLPAGAAVTLVVAVPYPRVPTVVGAAKTDAVARLQAAGFKVRVVTETRTSGQNGAVLRQDPGGRVKPHSVITVVVASVVRPVAPPVKSNCTPGYDPCLPPASDYDCAGGSGDGPEYAQGPIYVTGSDPYDLDRENDGIACET